MKGFFMLSLKSKLLALMVLVVCFTIEIFSLPPIKETNPAKVSSRRYYDTQESFINGQNNYTTIFSTYVVTDSTNTSFNYIDLHDVIVNNTPTATATNQVIAAAAKRLMAQSKDFFNIGSSDTVTYNVILNYSTWINSEFSSQIRSFDSSFRWSSTKFRIKYFPIYPDSIYIDTCWVLSQDLSTYQSTNPSQMLISGLMCSSKTALQRLDPPYSTDCADICYWRLVGNGNIDPSKHFLGTKNNAPLIIRTSDVEQMRITAGGGVGIHTQIVDAGIALQVNGALKANTAKFDGKVIAETIYIRLTL